MQAAKPKWRRSKARPRRLVGSLGGSGGTGEYRQQSSFLHFDALLGQLAGKRGMLDPCIVFVVFLALTTCGPYTLCSGVACTGGTAY